MIMYVKCFKNWIAQTCVIEETTKTRAVVDSVPTKRPGSSHGWNVRLREGDDRVPF